MRASWKEWVIRLALVAISLGGVWALWGPEIVAALSPPAEPPAPAPADSI